MDRKDARTAVVTGGAKGIGRGCALDLAEKGFDIVLVDLLDEELARTKGEIEALGRHCLTYHADVADFASVYDTRDKLHDSRSRRRDANAAYTLDATLDARERLARVKNLRASVRAEHRHSG